MRLHCFYFYFYFYFYFLLFCFVSGHTSGTMMTNTTELCGRSYFFNTIMEQTTAENFASVDQVERMYLAPSLVGWGFGGGGREYALTTLLPPPPHPPSLQTLPSIDDIFDVNPGEKILAYMWNSFLTNHEKQMYVAFSCHHIPLIPLAMTVPSPLQAGEA